MRFGLRNPALAAGREFLIRMRPKRRAAESVEARKRRNARGCADLALIGAPGRLSEVQDA